MVCCIVDPNSVELNIDGTTDKCSKGEDINFIFTGFTLSGKVGFKAYCTCTLYSRVQQNQSFDCTMCVLN